MIEKATAGVCDYTNRELNKPLVKSPVISLAAQANNNEIWIFI